MAKIMDIRFERGLSLAEALDIIYNDNIEGDVFVEPPAASVDTDEDSGNEDEGGLIDNLTSRQLRANAEIRLPSNEKLGIDYEEDIVQPTQMKPACRPQISEETKQWMNERKTQGNGASSKPEPLWEKGADFDIERPTSFPISDYSKYNNMHIIDIFEQFIDDTFIEHLVEESRRYALFLNYPDPKITADKIRCFIAILFVSGYNNLPSKRHYWDFHDDMKNIALSQAMRRDRFLQINRFLHCADNTQYDEKDKAWKICPCMEMLKKRCIENFIPEEHLSYDESMVKYYGRHGCNLFIRGKPIRFGHKMWCLNSKDGYLANFELYQGKGPKSDPEYEKMFGKAIY